MVLLAVYVALALLNDPGGYLGTDTGGKVATLRAMAERGRLDPDVGYWAERWDPDGLLHPLYYTAPIGERWVNVTTLPALLVAYPLFRLGGYRTILLIPMLGAVLAALAARALARRVGGSPGWGAFWIVGLASPLTVYALDFWEHSLGVALMAWGVVHLLRVLDGGAGWRGGAVAGLLFGGAATMRTEALVYAATATAVMAVLLARRRMPAALATAVALCAGLAVPLAANLVLEEVVVGTPIRLERAAGTARAAGQAGGSRLQEGLLTAVALEPDLKPGSWLIGAASAGLVAFVARRGRRGHGREQGPAMVAAAGVGALYAIRFAGGLGFVPGMLAATPLATVGLVAGGVRERRVVLAGVAVGALPLVWAVQYQGGAGPQWAGRYVLVSGLLLLTLGVVALADLAAWARTVLVALAAVVTAFGLAWLAARSHDVARTARALERRPEPVVVSRVAHLAREGGGFSGTASDHSWLTAVSEDDLERAGDVLGQAGVERFVYVAALDEEDAPPVAPAIEGFAPGATERITWIRGLQLQLTTYARSGA